MFGNNHVLRANDDAILAMADENRLSGILGRQRVAASFKMDEAIVAGLTRNEVDDLICPSHDLI